MLFSTLAEYFEKLEATSSRLALIDILCQLFKEVKTKEIAKVSYLIQGRVAPFYEPLEIGMAEKTVAASIAKAYGVEREEVLKEYGKAGDLGLVAEEIKIQKSKIKNMPIKSSILDKVGTTQNSKLSVTEVFNTLKEIAQTSGEGTVEKKQNLLVDLLKKMDGISAKHLVRIPLGVSRLGIGDPTILDAFAKLKLGDRLKRKLLEGGYNRVSDLGLIGETLWKGGLPAVEALSVQVGRPIRSQLAERLPNPQKVLEKMGKVNVQRKLDGFRCVTGYTPIYVKSKGVTVVRDLQVGDYVLTKTGSFKKVLAKNSRTIEKGERLFKFKTFLGEEIGISEGHQLLCLANGREEWRNIEYLKPGDEVIFPLPKFPLNNPHTAPESLELQTISGYKKTFNLNKNFYRFLGFWIGDGFTNDFHNTERVGILFNAKKEQELALFYEKIIKKELQVPTITRYTHDGCLSLYWRDEPLKHWLSTYFRREWVGKMIPEWFIHIGKERFEQFLEGWIESDGHVDKDGVIKIVTKERDLASFAQLIALSYGMVVGLHYVRVNYHIGRNVDHPISKTYYQLVIPKTGSKARIENDKLIVKVFSNNIVKYRDPRILLYDIQVQDDESFCIPMATLHNCQIHKNGDNVRLFSRNLEETTPMFPEIAEGVRVQIKAKSVILDSEAIGYNPTSSEFLPFQETTQRRRKYGISEMAKKIPLRAFCFDILYKDGKSLIDLDLVARLKKLEKTIESKPASPDERASRSRDEILVVEKGEMVSEANKLQEMLDEAISDGLEGLVVKRPDSKYEAGARNFNWVKLKRHSAGQLHDTIDCVILGYIYGRGKRAQFGAGALLVGVYDDSKDEFVTVSKIGTGLTDEEWREIKVKTQNSKVKGKPARVNSLIAPSVWVEPKMVIEVLADEITRSPVHTAGKREAEPGYALRFPRLIKFREADKKAEDATTVKELIEMYNQQFKK